MSDTQFWDGDCSLPKYYRKANEIKQRQRNQELWLQGLYVYEALLDVAPVLQAFAKKGTKQRPYPQEPFPITEAELAERKKRDEQHRIDKMKARMMTWATRTNIKIAQNAEKEVKRQDE